MTHPSDELVVDVCRQLEAVLTVRRHDGRQVVHEHGAAGVVRRQVDDDSLLEATQHRVVQLPANIRRRGVSRDVE